MTNKLTPTTCGSQGIESINYLPHGKQQCYYAGKYKKASLSEKEANTRIEERIEYEFGPSQIETTIEIKEIYHIPKKTNSTSTTTKPSRKLARPGQVKRNK